VSDTVVNKTGVDRTVLLPIIKVRMKTMIRFMIKRGAFFASMLSADPHPSNPWL
jgi:hypothetical protein